MAQGNFQEDAIKTGKGDLKITFIGHATLMFSFGGKIIHVDPWTKFVDYSTMPKADIILVTHEHGDHLDLSAVEKIIKKGTNIYCTKLCEDSLNKLVNNSKLSNVNIGVLPNGKEAKAYEIGILAVPAYNLSPGEGGRTYHPKGSGNGYVVDFGGTKVYIAGDTENIPEMKDLKDIDIAFLPVNRPYTMTPEMAVDAVKMFNPKILYPYHYGETDIDQLKNMLKDTKIEVRIRNMQ